LQGVVLRGKRILIGFLRVVVLGHFVVGSLFIWKLSQSGLDILSAPAMDLSLSYRTCSLVLSLVATSSIVCFVFRHVFSSPSKDRLFGSVVRILLQSASLEVSLVLAYLVTVGLSNPAQYVILPVLGQVQAIAPLWVFYQVSRRRQDFTQQAATSIAFKIPNPPLSSDSSVTKHTVDAMSILKPRSLITENDFRVNIHTILPDDSCSMSIYCLDSPDGSSPSPVYSPDDYVPLKSPLEEQPLIHNDKIRVSVSSGVASSYTILQKSGNG